jgi:hypothetical protein
MELIGNPQLQINNAKTRYRVVVLTSSSARDIVTHVLISRKFSRLLTP